MKQKVVIIGGGIIGLSCAYYLRKNGLEVTVLEKDDFANACSSGNQGWVCPALHAPVPEPGLVATSIKWLMKKDSPLYIKPSAMPQLSGWLTQFMKHCNEEDFKAGERALLKLSLSTLALYDSLQADGLEFEMHREGMLFVFLSESELNHKIEKLRNNQKVYGHDTPIVLSGDEVRELEPDLSKRIVGGILLENQRHVRPESLAKALMNKLTSLGVQLRSNTEVTGIERQDDKILAVMCRQERIEADQFVLTAGAWSGSLAKQLGYSLPMQAGKGYSITFSNPNVNISHPIYLGDSKAGVSPFQGAIRIGGTMELSGINTNLDKNRIQGIRQSVSKYLTDELHGESEMEWTGMRPMTPDGLPVLGKIPYWNNAFVATGHGMVGVAMAPASGKIMADLICSGETEFDIQSFSTSRFQKELKRNSPV
ncbi:NAD(P)/FAD-dependent oxidoreductase [Neobacillus mesonae]|uniref:NAD(P)/FAD-dependent oxidoreductase n=1 Tax=Neobacillus mesonae TaxID=1193713 RepID=UPI002E1E3120|nr:FAD-dependent oxidoreductase [Neobacillus mesonae]MED4205409.1 FAD-dependent oxidoreductase [Neobacillus mesonae]